MSLSLNSLGYSSLCRLNYRSPNSRFDRANWAERFVEASLLLVDIYGFHDVALLDC